MISYTVEKLDRSRVVLSCGILSAVLAIICSSAITSVIENLHLDLLQSSLIILIEACEGVSPLCFYGIIWIVYDKYLWRTSLFYRFHNVPNLNGVWEGEGESSYVDPETNKNVKFGMKLIICQTYSKISIQSKFKNSEGYITSAGISQVMGNKTCCFLELAYYNEAYNTTKSKFGWDSSHKGVEWLKVDGTHMRGDYVTNRNSVTWGTMHLEKT